MTISTMTANTTAMATASANANANATATATATATTDLAISAYRLSLRIEGQTVLDDVSLDVPPGAVVGLVGRNGAGKSTLMRCLLGLSVPESGHSSLLNCPSTALDDPTRERLGHVAQSPDLFEWMNVWEHLRVVGRAYARWSADRTIKLATQLDLPLGARAGALSHGDQQKLAVVLAMSHDPDLLLLDEPVSSLDPLARRAFMRSLFSMRDASEAPRTVLLSSHLLGDLERVVSHVAFMRGGRLQLFDEWDMLTEHLRVQQAVGDSDALHVANDGRAVVDTRRSHCAADARAVPLDELFLVLNS